MDAYSSSEKLTATVSGSFHRHLSFIYETVGALRELGITVLSPSDPRIVGSIGEFLFVASDRFCSAHLVQERHFQCIRRSSFLWLVAPDGYVGQSAAMEIGFAAATSTPVFCEGRLSDVTLSNYVRTSFTIENAVAEMRARQVKQEPEEHLLIEPETSIERMHGSLDVFRRSLCNPKDKGLSETSYNATKKVFHLCFGLSGCDQLMTSTQRIFSTCVD